MKTIEVRTDARIDMVEITREVQAYLGESGVEQGAVLVYIPHTTAGVTINENADPTVEHDLQEDFQRLVPRTQPYYRHREGNSASHMLSSMIHSSVTIPFEGRSLALGTWQGIFLCDFDGPRTRKVHLQILPA
ncbi:MAG: secondary thiamine-phosphate synthase enzyme YjbQ [Anaerolineales bacterium]|nr:secondary thiamine-phosphate synthase enzyme YjbQ [Anaerolineales bacterium]